MEATYKEYLQHLIEGNKMECHRVIKEGLERGLKIKNLYNQVFAPVMIHVGELWQKNQFTVAQEHLATAITQSVMSSLYYQLFHETQAKRKGKILLTCPGNELHEMGVRMLADLMEMDGWNVIYLGANMPSFSVMEMIEKEQPDIVGVSCTMSFNLKHAKELVEKIKERYENLPIMVGGMVFNIDPTLIKYVGGDHYGKTFDETLELLDKLNLNKIKHE
ncbi:cobalamin B12-binding domain-containing protein [Alkaliphilus hydrothermalis]|uniref:Methanogenic corrinoid protein MtbC1 n=1 Tax=Alkaliphilus hydrothermalis TaxID=1482730 RepID=A0ABS2NT63_9FIRM|nr:cobalamin-dependent protein [Alkaliphilus hydrothermalis]MBM7616143.1 methanogenic corrinoid protein MtbC1 [Alkaliphilus hydrothermalis]